MQKIICSIILFGLVFLPPLKSFATGSSGYHLYIDRKNLQLYVMDKDDRIVFKTACGIGRGGLKIKKSMSDYITPTGEFFVDLILYSDSKYNSIARSNIEKYKDNKNYSKLTSTPNELSELFGNMNKIDFNHDGKPDHAYGRGYIGLDSKNAVTGPKMKLYRGIPYWYSIALHGTPSEENVGQANSGGCVHLKKDDISRLIENGMVKIGTRVTIGDGPP